MKRSAMLPAATALALFCIFIGVAALSTDYGPGPVTIDDTTKATNRYLGVSFSHSTHVAKVGLTCVMCHHTEKKDFVSGTPTRCEVCHNADAEISFKDSMHRRCVMCHIKKVKEGQIGAGGKTEEGYREVPPTQCLQCHRQRR